MAIDILRGVGPREELAKFLPNISLLGSLAVLHGSVDYTEALIPLPAMAALPWDLLSTEQRCRKHCKLLLVQGWPCLS